jgi:hypothetical protein
MQGMGLKMICYGMAVRRMGMLKSEYDKDEGTDCKDGNSDTDW